MALGSGISVSMGGGSSGDTVHVNNQPMIVLLVPFRKGGVALGGGEGFRRRVHIKVFLHTCFSCSFFLDLLVLPSSNPSAANSHCIIFLSHLCSSFAH